MQTLIALFKSVVTVLLAGLPSLNYSCVNKSHHRLMVQSSEMELRTAGPMSICFGGITRVFMPRFSL